MIEGCDGIRHLTLLHVDRHEMVERTESSCCAAVEGLRIETLFDDGASKS